jgi:L-malate glycosyltransferase
LHSEAFSAQQGMLAMSAPADLHTLARLCGQETEGISSGLGRTATTLLVVELLRRGHEITLFTFSHGLAKETVHDLGQLRLFVGSAREYGASRNFYRPEIAYLSRVIKREKPAFVHAHWSYEFALGALATGIPTVTTIHGLPWNVLRYFRDRSRVIRLLMAYLVAARCRRYTAVSQDATNHFRQYLKPGAEIEVIPNLLSDNIFEIDRSTVNATRPLTFGTVLQGWSKRKNASAARKAFRAVIRTAPETRLIMIGNGYEKEGPAHRWARRHNLDAGVTFVGLVPYEQMLRPVRDGVDIIVHPLPDEAFSMTVLESMALAKPVIARKDTLGIREALRGGGAEVLADLQDSNSTAHAMTRLMANPTYRQQVAHSGYQYVASTYRKDFIVPQYEAVYGDMSSSMKRNLPSLSHYAFPRLLILDSSRSSQCC